MMLTNTCQTCIHWQIPTNVDSERAFDLCSPMDPVTYEREPDEGAIAKKWGHIVRQCANPRLLFYERPPRNGESVVDGSEYFAGLLTGPDFGCTMHESGGK